MTTTEELLAADLAVLEDIIKGWRAIGVNKHANALQRIHDRLASPRAVEGVVVKALEWQADKTARPFGLLYIVSTYRNPLGDGRISWLSSLDGKGIGNHDSEAAAKAAAQADFEARILSCLSTPSPEQAKEPIAWQKRHRDDSEWLPSEADPEFRSVYGDIYDFRPLYAGAVIAAASPIPAPEKEATDV